MYPAGVVLSIAGVFLNVRPPFLFPEQGDDDKVKTPMQSCLHASRHSKLQY